MKTAQRLFVTQPLAVDLAVTLDPGQAHYLAHVLRLAPGARVDLFNGRDGDWEARLEIAGRKGGTARCVRQLRPQDTVPDLMICFAPIKGDRLEAIVEKATEFGAAILQPVITERTIVRKLNLERLSARAIEAAEQTVRTTFPELRPPVPLIQLMHDWPQNRALLFADEGGDCPPLLDVASGLTGPVACLTGPEGGFTPGERALIRSHAATRPVNLGPRILRADTAAFACLALLQAAWGDWQGGSI